MSFPLTCYIHFFLCPDRLAAADGTPAARREAQAKLASAVSADAGVFVKKILFG